MKTAIVIINYKTPWHLKKCLESVFKFTKDFHIILVQNSPDEKSLELSQKYYDEHPQDLTVTVNKENLGFVGGINSVYSEIMKYERFCLLNSDTVVTENWLSELNKLMDERSDIVQVSPDTNTLHLYREKLSRKLIRKIPGIAKWDELRPLKSEYPEKGFKEYVRFFNFPGGYCNLMRTKYFADRGFIIDPNIIHGYWDEFDVTSFLRSFGRVGWTDKSYVYHFHGVSFGKIREDSKGMKNQLKLLNGLYVMDKWRDFVSKELKEMSQEEVLARTDTDTMKMALMYFGLVDQKPELKEYIRSIPAREIGKKFLN